MAIEPAFATGNTALVLGGAACVWDDLARLKEITGPWPGIVLAVNEAGAAYEGHLDHWVSLHPEKFAQWEPTRAGNRDYVKWGGVWQRRVPPPGTVDRTIPAWGIGTSAMHAVAVAYELSIPKVVICGAPLDMQPHFHSSEPWQHGAQHHQAWRDHEERMQGRVKSMSGFTRDLLGYPDKEWLNC